MCPSPDTHGVHGARQGAQRGRGGGEAVDTDAGVSVGMGFCRGWGNTREAFGDPPTLPSAQEHGGGADGRGLPERLPHRLCIQPASGHCRGDFPLPPVSKTRYPAQPILVLLSPTQNPPKHRASQSVSQGSISLPAPLIPASLVPALMGAGCQGGQIQLEPLVLLHQPCVYLSTGLWHWRCLGWHTWSRGRCDPLGRRDQGMAHSEGHGTPLSLSLGCPPALSPKWAVRETPLSMSLGCLVPVCPPALSPHQGGCGTPMFDCVLVSSGCWIPSKVWAWTHLMTGTTGPSFRSF